MLWLEVACNDPDNGLFMRRAQQLQVGNAEFEARNDECPPAFEIRNDTIRLAGKTWMVTESKEWVGNWCWNHYLLATPKLTPRWYLVDFIIWLRNRGLFHCTTAEAEFYDWFNGPAQLPPTGVHRLLGGLE